MGVYTRRRERREAELAERKAAEAAEDMQQNGSTGENDGDDDPNGSNAPGANQTKGEGTSGQTSTSGGNGQTPEGALSDALELLKLSVAKLRPEFAKIEDVTVLAALLAGEEAGQKRGTIIADLTHRIAAHSQPTE